MDTPAPPGPNWIQLVRLAQKGQVPAFDALVARFRPAVYSVCRARGCSRERGEDVAQATFVRAYLRLPSLRDPARFPAWLHAIARNLASQPVHAELSLDDIDHLVTFLSTTISSRAWSCVDGSIDCEPVRASVCGLPEALSMPAQLVYLQEWSVADAAAFLDLPVTTVKWRLHEARQALRHQFPEHLALRP